MVRIAATWMLLNYLADLFNRTMFPPDGNAALAVVCGIAIGAGYLGPAVTKYRNRDM